MNYKKQMLKLVTEDQLNKWLDENPKPSNWEGNKYSWAYTEMPVYKGGLLSGILRSIVGKKN